MENDRVRVLDFKLKKGAKETAVTFIKGKEGREKELKRELLALAAPTRAGAGNVQYDLYQSPVKKSQFMRLEVWRSARALEDHKATPHIKASFDKRQKQGWTKEIIPWKGVPGDVKLCQRRLF